MSAIITHGLEPSFATAKMSKDEAAIVMALELMARNNGDVICRGRQSS
jgi:hypothetical protein